MTGMTAGRDVNCLQISLLAGAAATTNIAVTGIVTTDEIIAAFHISTAASIATMADITSEVSVTSAGNVQLSSTDTTSDQLFLFWNKLSRC